MRTCASRSAARRLHFAPGMGSVAHKRYVSQHRLEGSLADAPLPHLLDQLRGLLFTGTVKITAGRTTGTLHLRAGIVDAAQCGTLTGDAARAKIASLRDGMYEIRQRLPDLSGELGSAASLEGEITDVPLAAIMRHCEDNALTCTIIVIGGFDRGEVVYRAGEIADVLLNGRKDPDAIVDITAWKDARFRVTAPPLSLNVNGWPSVGREPTAPFRVERHAPPDGLGVASVLPSAVSLRPAVMKRLVDLLGRKR